MSRPFHDFEQAQWQRAVEPYDAHWSRLTGQAVPAMLSCLGAGPGTRLLDLASGPGHLAQRAAELGAEVVGVDFAPSMVARARSLHPGLRFEEGDAEQLGFPARSFQAVAMNFGILHLDRPHDALGEARRVLEPGGRFGFTAWAGPAEAAGFATVLRAVERHGGQVELPEGPDFFAFGEPGRCLEALRAAGFAEAQVERLDLRWRLDAPGDFFAAFYGGTARTGALLRGQDGQALEHISAAVAEAVAAFSSPRGGIEVPMPALLAYAEKPWASL
ncbi:MAG: methyltransferase domain-containing protein [Candidatus Dormibacteraeota bacterium]|nr:methyltransferase domain-containing protein [Candidatus Dormibacteraeota bacterium]